MYGVIVPAKQKRLGKDNWLETPNSPCLEECMQTRLGQLHKAAILLL
jgi:hypothetical protein